jgi:hypothetical protein
MPHPLGGSRQKNKAADDVKIKIKILSKLLPQDDFEVVEDQGNRER